MTDKNYKYAVVDLEATGAHSQAKIIQVGIVIIENGVITQTYQTDVNPHEHLDYHIQELTGLTDKQLAKAPDFSQVAREIYDLIHDAIFVAHNVKFDANLLAEELFWEGFDLLTPRVDTVELAQTFFPTFSKYGLGYLCEQFLIPLEQAHTAISDAHATAQLFLKIQEKIRSLPKSLVEKILLFSDNLLYESRLAIEEVFGQMLDDVADDLEEVQGLYLKRSRPKLSESKLSSDFAKNIALLGLEERADQELFASHMEKALEGATVNFLQAQTGLGKTYGYLLPILAKSKERVLVSLPTKLLQDQIMAQEARQIEQIFQIPFHSLKGKENYLKLDAFYHSLQKDAENRQTQRCKMEILVWLTETETGDLDEFSQKYRNQAYFDEIKHDGKLNKKSPFYGVDFWRITQKKAKESRVLVTNHAYFLTGLEDKSASFSDRIVVVDEAQKLFLALENQAKTSLRLFPILQEIQQELSKKSSILQKRLLESLQFELTSSFDYFKKHRYSEIKAKKLEKIRQDLAELSGDSLSELKRLFSDKFDYFWYEKDDVEGYSITRLNAARLDLLRFRDFLPETTKIMMVSATLEISRKVSLAQLLGFTDYDFYHMPHQRNFQQKLYVDQTFPDIQDLSLEDYASEIVKRLRDLQVLRKPILCLFTSKELLLKVSEQLSIPHLAQYKNGDPIHLKRRFDRGDSQILLGASSFWEGIDFAKQNQIIEVITRLPFDNPTDKLVQKINHHLRKEKKNPFYDYSLPVAILRLKQAIGRIQRNQKQKSAVLVLDNRLMKKRYSRQILSALKDVADLETVGEGQLQQRIESFFSKKGKKDS